MRREYQIRMSGRELLSYRDAAVECQLTCFFDPAHRAYQIVLSDRFKSLNGEPVNLSVSQLELIEGRLKEYLGTERLFGIPIRNNTVSVMREQSAI